jgi:hypothetical protein
MESLAFVTAALFILKPFPTLMPPQSKLMMTLMDAGIGGQSVVPTAILLWFYRFKCGSIGRKVMILDHVEILKPPPDLR